MLTEGQKIAGDLSYAPLPQGVVDKETRRPGEGEVGR